MALTEAGITRTEDGGVFCAACGNDLSKDGSTRFMGHLDGATFYINQFACTACGNAMSQRHERSAEDALWWAE